MGGCSFEKNSNVTPATTTEAVAEAIKGNG